MWILTFFGIILFLLLLFILVVRSKVLQSNNGFAKKLAGKSGITYLFVLASFLTLSNYLFFYAKPGFQYYLVFPTGGKHVITTSGFKWRGFARVQEWQKFIDIKVVTSEEPEEGIEGVITGGIPIRFIDQVTASVKISVRMQMPEDFDSFVKLAEEFRHPKNLVNNTLVPTVKEQVINTGYMYAAQDYISGAASDFRQTLDEQLKFGGYSVERKEFYDTVYADIQADNRVIKEVNTRYEVTKRLTLDGTPVRNEHDITKNNIIVSQVIVDQIVLEEAFKRRLEAQRDISAQKRIELEKIETAKAEQQRIIAEGERDKAAERVAQEKEQVKALIAIETEKKQESTKRDLAEIALQTARLEAQAKKVKADAEAYQNAKLVSAGLTPQERAMIEKEIAIGVAGELSKLNLPDVYISGNDGKNTSGLLESLIGADLAKKMMAKTK